jgi:glycosyltransferase involved in cell wall biosynthesis
LERRIASAGLRERVGLAGPLGAEQMRWGFEQCRAFVTTSRAEACPNTALEALHHGSLVVSTDRPPMPEILGEAPLYYRDGDVGGLVAALGRLGDLSPADGEARRAVARRRAAGFTWERAVRETVDALETAHGSVPR